MADKTATIIRSPKNKEVPKRFFFPREVLALYPTPLRTMIADREGYTLTHEQAAQLIENIQRFYAHVTPDHIEQLNQPIPQPERVKQPKPSPKPKPLPKPGTVYVIKAEKTGLYKIGYTINPEQRLKQLQLSSPDILHYVIEIQIGDMVALEKRLHEEYADKRVNGEWFNLTPEDVQSIWENR